jgi:DNA-binding CsgD family transcriptional regulator
VSIRHRKIQPQDLHKCIEIIAAHPVAGPRYGDSLGELHSAWLGLLRRDAFHGVVFEETNGARARTFGVGVSAFVSDEFVREFKRPPFFWLGRELARRVASGDSPVLSDKAVAEANSTSGLNLIVWEGCWLPEDEFRREVQNDVVTFFIDYHRGYRLKEWLLQPEREEFLRLIIESGALLVGDDGEYTSSLGSTLTEVFARPHVAGLTRDAALRSFGAWITTLFVYQSPQFGFRPSEQRLLLAALAGGTDKELADELGISLSAVKKTWRSIYGRVAERDPELLPDTPEHEDSGTERGKSKKYRLLTFLRDHREELRPFLPELMS